MKFIVSESLYISEEMIAEIRKCSIPEVIAEFEL